MAVLTSEDAGRARAVRTTASSAASSFPAAAIREAAPTAKATMPAAAHRAEAMTSGAAAAGGFRVGRAIAVVATMAGPNAIPITVAGIGQRAMALPGASTAAKSVATSRAAGTSGTKRATRSHPGLAIAKPNDAG